MSTPSAIVTTEVEENTSTDTAGRPRAALILGLLLVLFVFAAFQRVASFDFIDIDDGLNVFQNPHYHPLTGQGVAQFWIKPYNFLYMPATYTVWAGAAALAQLNEPAARLSGDITWLAPDVFHWLSLLFHLINVLLVFTLLRRFVKSAGAAAAGAALFGIHPLQVESVAWVTGFNNVLSGFFCLLALLAYVDDATHPNASPGRPGWRYGLATALFALALLSKPTAASLPLVALVLDIGLLRRPWHRILPLLAPWAVLAVAIAIVTRFSSDSSTGLVYLPYWGRPVVVLDALGFYAVKVIAPVALSFDYGRPPVAVLHSWWGYASAIAVAAVLLILWRKKVHAVLLPIALFAAATAPMLGFVPFYSQHTATVADRFAYLALLAPSLALAVALARWPRRPAFAAVLVVLAGFAVLTSAQTHAWRSSDTLARYILTQNPNSRHATLLLGLYYSRKGNVDEALRYYARTIELNAISEEARYNYGSLLLRTGHINEGIAQLEVARQLKPDDADTRVNLGTAYLVQGRLPEAVSELEAAARLSPHSAFILGQYGEALRRSRDARAIAVLEEAVARDAGLPIPRASLALALMELSPPDTGTLARARTEAERALADGADNAEVQYRVGLFYRRTGDLTRADECLRTALRLDPAHTGARKALQSAAPKTP